MNGLDTYIDSILNSRLGLQRNWFQRVLRMQGSTMADISSALSKEKSKTLSVPQG